jgi:hypothetical protein
MTTPRTSAGTPTVGHDVEPRLDTLYSMEGSNTGLPANPLKPFHYPIETICKVCGQVVRSEHAYTAVPWVHTGRMPGEMA